MTAQNDKRGDHTIVFKTSEMPEEMLSRIVDMAVFVLDKYIVERDMASAL